MKNFTFRLTPQHHHVGLTLLSGIGSRRARTILSYFNSLDEFFTEKKLNLHSIPGIPANFVNWSHRQKALEEADKILARVHHLGADTVFITDEQYPRRLRNCDDAPLLLYRKGEMDLNGPRVISIVGTRHSSDYGRDLTEQLVRDLKPVDAVVVSGMAYGIDIIAHRQAVTENLQTVGVLGHGIDFMYPFEHRKVAENMTHFGGLLTEIPPGFKPEAAYFPMRNRIVAGLCDAVVVVESGEKGGSLITANQAFDYNKDVFAFPGDVTREFSKGCLKLIQQDKARLITGSGDFLRYMNWEVSTRNEVVQRKLFPECTPEEQQILDCIQGKKDAVLDLIAYECQLPVSKVSTLLFTLEFKGVVRSLPGKKYAVI